MSGINVGRNLPPDIRTGTGGAGGATRVSGPPQTLEDAAQQRPQGPSYFGYHTDSSIAARMAQQGIAPNPLNLRVATEMLRYGIPLSADGLNQLRQLWQGMGGTSLIELESLLALFSQGLDVDPTNMAAMGQLIGGGPQSQLLGQLTMALKNGGGPQFAELQAQLQQYWKLGSGPDKLGAELAQFQALNQRLERFVGGLDPRRVPDELAGQLGQLKDLFQAQRMLVPPKTSVYVPFYQWRDQQPMPGELLVTTDERPEAQAAGFAQVTLAIDTRNLGRVTLDFTAIRGHLSVKVEVQDKSTKQFLERGLPDLRHRLTFRTPYQVATIQCQESGAGRAISVLLPRRRDPRKLGRAIGVI